MHLSSKRMNVAAIVGRIGQKSKARPLPLAASGSNSFVPARGYSHFRPVYSVQAAGNRYLQRQQLRPANTSSGIYAPSTIATDRHQLTHSHEPSIQASVFETSDHLPSLPVPELHSVLEKLKETISPVAMNSTEFVQTLDLIDEFAHSAGPKLDLLLRNKAEATKNWITHDWWSDEAYLRRREPLVINSNPSMVYPSFPFEVNNKRALFNVISQLISGIVEFKLALIHGYNPEATSADNECRLDPNTCYSQYKNVFGSTRLPGQQIDSVLPGSTTLSGPFTIVLSYQGKFFEIQLNELEDENGRIEKVASILDIIIGSQQQTEIDSMNAQSTDGVGVLTTTNRGDWSKTIKLLDEDSMSAIKAAEFVVCIDTIRPDESNETSKSISRPLLSEMPGSERYSAALARQILHGDSSNVGNRWFDKAIQLIVVADERAERLLGAGLNYEHSVAEGTIISKLIEYSYDKTVQKNRESSAEANNFFAQQKVPTRQATVFRQLRMFDDNQADELNELIRQAKQDYLAHVDQFDLSHLRYKQYGSNAIKSWHFSPDSWFQVALQSAYYNLHKRLGPCYESASTRRFAYGRTETIRSLTKEVANFCHEPRFDTLQSAIQSHKSYAVSANHGEAIDRVLLGYKMTFNELRNKTWSWGLPAAITPSNKMIYSDEQDSPVDLEKVFTEDELNIIIAFFNNELIKRSTKFSLSTSQVSTHHTDICMSYGPILADGYGCCYNITGQQIVAAITANSSNQSFSCEVHKFNESLRNSLDRMRDIVEEQRSKSNK